MTAAHIADAPAGNWVDRFLPPILRPYARLMRLDRPIGWWLLLIPCWWGLALATIAKGGGIPDLRFAALFLIGAIVMRGAGCTVNDIADRDIDAKVARTQARPIPSGAVSETAAWAFLALLCLIGLAILLQFDRNTIITGAVSLGLVAVYPLMKRVTDWPQAVLGLAFNWGALMGWSAVHGSLALPAFLLYGGGIAWTLAYDTIYAHQDKEDDAIAGVRSTALRFGDRSKPWIAAFFGAAIALIACAVFAAGGGFFAYLGVAAAALHAARQIASLDIADPANCRSLFLSNRTFGLLVLAGFLADSLAR